MSLINSKKGDDLFAFSSSHQGASHKKTGKVCQDAAFARYRQGRDKYAVAIVSDGHGSDNYFRSDRGARLAVEATREAISGFMENFLKPNSPKQQELYEALCRKPDEFMRQLEANILYQWQEKIGNDYREEPFTTEELTLMKEDARRKYEASPDTRFVKAYGATLIAVVVFPGRFWFGLHIGDGKCVAQSPDGEFYQPIPWDDTCFLNVTTSLCDANPLSRFRHCFHIEDFPSAIFVGSDGIDDCFANDEDLYGFYGEVIQTFREKKDKDAYADVDAYLPIMSEKGSGDDISMSGIVNK